MINIGEVMARWTNDMFLPTPHRVINRFGRERYSVPFFALPDWDAIIVPVPSSCGPGNPQKYPPRRAALCWQAWMIPACKRRDGQPGWP